MDRPPLRLTSVMGVAHALLATVPPRDTAVILVSEYGWDAAFLALAHLRGDPAREAFALVWQHLVVESVENDLRGVAWPSDPA